MGKKEKLSPLAREDVRKSHKEGQSIRSIAKRYRVSRDTVYRVLRE
ncbi:Helix-turn-helix domain of resolvase [Acetobacter malorum]|uniref:Helix-turn-helix domain of resolvase n=1 Tax=Acetobacter malorum TaxID=178901 RepID=A0A177G6X4_9PROT|nr:Helix-turn-helix domain of resolvase [Acetobacter malorum]